ncbi:MAG: S8 family serine peptidase, partial [Chloroflexota bacterium]
MKPVAPFLWTATLLLAFLLPGLDVFGALAEGSLENRLIEKASTELGFSPYTIQQASVQRREFPLSGVTLYQVKFYEEATGRTYTQVMDETGVVKALSEARRTEETVHDARLSLLLSEDSGMSIDTAAAMLKETSHGRLSHVLLDQLETMDGAETILVAVWLKADHLISPKRPDIEHQPTKAEAGDAPFVPDPTNHQKAKPEREDRSEKNAEQEMLADRIESLRRSQDDSRFDIEDARYERLTYLSDQMSDLQQPLLKELADIGYEPRYVSPLAPLVYVELPKYAILELVFKESVDTIYGPNVNQDGLNVAKPTQKADIIDNTFGFDGSGIDVAITEDSRVEFGNLYLNAGTTRVPGDTNVDDHATVCAGMVASQHGTYQGISQGVSLFSANGTDYNDANMAAAMDWAAITQNVDIMNNSWGGNDLSGSFNEHDRHADYLVRQYACTFVAIAHNDGTDPSHYVRSPGKAYNVITVGAYDDNNSLTWDDDVIAAYSSFNNPSTGCEKPEVAASGSLIYSTIMSNPWLGYGGSGSGTSYAAPMVSGAAAVLMDRNASLEGWPEAVKAVLMATALHNIEGSSRLSEKDGAGGIDMRAAFRTVDEGWWDARSVVQGDFPHQYSVYAYAGQKIRAAIAWDSNPNAGYTTDPLEADLDLRLKNPGGTVVATSASGLNSFEVIEYTATVTGTYTLEAHVFSWSGTNSTYLGVAWWPGHRVLSTAIQSYGTPPVSRDYYQFNPNAGFWNVVGIRSPAASSSYNYNIYLYADSAFADPADHTWLEDSILSSSLVDYVLIDANHAADHDYFVEVAAITGSGNYPVQFWNSADSLSDGIHTSTITTLFLL